MGFSGSFPQSGSLFIHWNLRKQLNSHRTLIPMQLEPGSHWCKVSALAATSPMLPNKLHYMGHYISIIHTKWLYGLYEPRCSPVKASQRLTGWSLLVLIKLMREWKSLLITRRQMHENIINIIIIFITSKCQGPLMTWKGTNRSHRLSLLLSFSKLNSKEKHRSISSGNGQVLYHVLNYYHCYHFCEIFRWLCSV